MIREEPKADDVALAKRIGARIRARRNELGLSQEALAYPRYSKGYLSQIEKGRTLPSLKCLVYISKRLGRPLDWFVSDNPAYRSPLCEIASELEVL